MGNIIFGELDERQTIKDSVHQNKLTIELVNKCGGRCHVNQQDEYSNNQFLEEQILKTIEETLEANGGSCCTNDIAKAVAEIIQRHKKQPDGRELKDILIKLAGITTGVLLGALVGVVFVVRDIVTVIKKPLSDPSNALKIILEVKAAAKLIGGGGTVRAVVGSLAIILVVGAMQGGSIGNNAAEGANTPQEAAKRAAEAIKKEVLSALEALGI